MLSLNQIEKLAPEVNSVDSTKITISTDVGETEHELKLFSYKNCSRDTSELIKKCRGIICDSTTGQTLFQGEPFTDEFTPDDVPLDEVKDGDFRVSYEGTMIRFLFYGGKWIASTNKRLDMFRSRWGGPVSFGDIFTKSLTTSYEDFLKSLDKQKQHVFLLTSNNQTRIVSKHESSMIFKMYEVSDGVISYECNELPQVNTTDVAQYIENTDIKTQQGLLIILPSSGKSYKVVSEDYLKKASLRGNESSIRFRYLQLRTSIDDVENFVELYNEHTDMFNECEDLIEQVVDRLLKEYISRYIRKQFKTLPKYEHWILKQTHQWHCEDRDNNKVHWEIVSNILNNSSPSLVNNLMRRQYAINNDLIKPDTRPAQQSNVVRDGEPYIHPERQQSVAV